MSDSRPAPIALHLGAHKTGTTFIQQTYLANRAALAGEGVAFVPLRVMRRQVTPAASDGGGGETAAEARQTIAGIEGAIRRCRRIIVSDENIVGGAPGPKANGVLYPRLAGRLVRFRDDVLSGRRLTAYFCVRRYDRILPSMYCEAIRHRPFFTFDELLDGFDLTRLSWVSVIGAMAEILGEENLVLWDFDHFVADPGSPLAAIADVAGPALSVSDELRRRRPSASADAIAALAALRPAMSDEAIQGRVRDMERAYPLGPHAAFSPFPDSVAKELAGRHAADWEAIRRGFPRARILGEARPE